MPDGSGSNGGQAGSSGAAPSASNPAPPEGRVSRWTLVRQEVETNYKQRNAKMQTMFKALIMEARDEKDRHPCDMSGALDAGFSTGKVAAPGAVLAVDDKDGKKIEKHDAQMRKIQMTAMKESYREVQSRRKSLEMKNGGGLGPQKKATSQALEEKARMMAQVGSKAPAPSGAVRAIRKTNVVMQLEKREWLIDPRTSVFIGKWDMITGVALIFTALFTPFEIAYLSSPARWYDKTFLANRTVDIIFIIDIVIQFNLMQSVSDKYGDRWITDHWDIIKRYLRGWFAIDTCSTLISIVDIISVMGSDDLHQLKILRVMRVLRLIKLARLARVAHRRALRDAPRHRLFDARVDTYHRLPTDVHASLRVLVHGGRLLHAADARDDLAGRDGLLRQRDAPRFGRPPESRSTLSRLAPTLRGITIGRTISTRTPRLSTRTRTGREHRMVVPLALHDLFRVDVLGGDDDYLNWLWRHRRDEGQSTRAAPRNHHHAPFRVCVGSGRCDFLLADRLNVGEQACV